MQAAEAPVDVDVLPETIRKTYADVATDQSQEFIFPTGRASAQELRYREPELTRVGSEGSVPGDELGDLQSVLRPELAVLVDATLSVAEPTDYGDGQRARAIPGAAGRSRRAAVRSRRKRIGGLRARPSACITKPSSSG
jgi:hypothetical protein